MSQSKETNELDAALSKAQGAMEPAVFDKVNPHFKSKYASLASIRASIRKPFFDNGLSVTQTTQNHLSAGPVLVTRLAHASGQYITSEYQLRPNLAPQAMASDRTYARRQELSSVCGVVADDDDDANEATKAVATNGKRENPNVNRAQDFTEHEVQYDSEGNPVDNIPYGNPQLQQVRGVTARKEYETLQGEMIAITTTKGLMTWANLSQTKDRVQTLSTEWQQHIRDLYEGRKKELGAADPRTA